MKSRSTILIAVVAAIVLAVILLNAIGFGWPFRLVHDQVYNPVGSRMVGIRNYVSEQFGFLGSISRLGQENKELKAEVLDLRNQLSALKEVGHENELLRAQLNFNARLNLQLLPARVVSTEPDNSRRFITIDRGSSSGVQVGQAVISSGVLVGTIYQVNDYSSKVFLVSDPEFRIRAIGQDGRAQGIVRGQIGQGYTFEDVAQGEKVSQGEQIISAGSGLVPQGILIGQVESVTKADNAVFQSASLKPLISLNTLELVFVVTGLKQ
jgi:rod shape-determining protein MreC